MAKRDDHTAQLSYGDNPHAMSISVPKELRDEISKVAGILGVKYSHVVCLALETALPTILAQPKRYRNTLETHFMERQRLTNELHKIQEKQGI